MPAAGGPARVLCGETGLGFGGTWNDDDVILFSGDRLRRVDADGSSACTSVGEADPGTSIRFPVFLPNGEHFFYSRVSPREEASQGVYLASLDDPTGVRVLSDDSSVIYTPPAGAGARAHLLFLREDALMAQPFDDVALQPVGDPFLVATGGSRSSTRTQVAASAAASGTLVYLAGKSSEGQPTWFDLRGRPLETLGSLMSVPSGVTVAPDGQAVVATGLYGYQIPSRLYELRGPETRLGPVGVEGVGAVVWSPDGSRVWYFLGPEGPEGPGLYEQAVGGDRVTLVQAADPAAPPRYVSDWSRDGRFLIYTENHPRTQADIWSVPVESGRPSGEAVRLLGTDVFESQGQLSPDGQWLAYTSEDDSGMGQVSVRPFARGGARVWPVSANGGREPRWHSDGEELYFLTGTAHKTTLMAVSVASDGRGGLDIGAPRGLFDFAAFSIIPFANLWTYSPAPDGQRFLVNAMTQTAAPRINVITNWHDAVQGGRQRGSD